MLLFASSWDLSCCGFPLHNLLGGLVTWSMDSAGSLAPCVDSPGRCLVDFLIIDLSIVGRVDINSFDLCFSGT